MERTAEKHRAHQTKSQFGLRQDQTSQMTTPSSRHHTPVLAQTHHNSESLGESSLSWIRDWIYPQGQSDSMRMMGWSKSAAPASKEDGIKMQPKDILDLSQYENQLEPPKELMEAGDEEMPEPTEEEKAQTTELSQAISFNKDEGQISGLG